MKEEYINAAIIVCEKQTFCIKHQQTAQSSEVRTDNLLKTSYYSSLLSLRLHLGQQRASSLRVRRKALVTEPVTLEPKLVLQNLPISHSKSQE